MAVGICAALPQEARTLARVPPAAGTCLRLADGRLLAVAGVGARRARIGGTQLLDGGATALVSWGSAGALDPTLEAGALLLPQLVIAPDGRALLADRNWQERVVESLDGRVSAHAGPLAQVGRVIRTPDEKRDLHRRSGAVAIDMESAALADLAREAGVPFLAVRAVTDTAGMTIPASITRAVDGTGRLRLARLLLGVLAGRGDVLTLLQLGRCFRMARTTLTALARTTALLSDPRRTAIERTLEAGPQP